MPGRNRERAAHVRLARRAPELMLRCRPRRTSERAPYRDTQFHADPARKQLRLIEPALATTRGMNGNGHENVTANGYAPPPFSHEISQRLDQPQLAVVLQRVNRGSRRSVERRAPLELDDARWARRWQADRRAWGLIEPAREVAIARPTQRCTLDSTPGAGGREQNVEQSLHDIRLAAYSNR